MAAVGDGDLGVEEGCGVCNGVHGVWIWCDENSWYCMMMSELRAGTCCCPLIQSGPCFLMTWHSLSS